MTRRLIHALTLSGGLLVVVGLVLHFGLVVRPVLAQDPPPRPTLEPTLTPTPLPPPTPTPIGDSAPSPTDIPLGRIIGTVIDLTTGAPAPGIRVAVGDVTVTTDANGNYERAGLPPGSYNVELVLTAAQGTPAQGPISVDLAGGATVVQHLAFRSPVAAATPTVVPATPVPQPTATPATPIALPDTGVSAGNSWAFLGSLAALLALLVGIGIWGGTEWSRRKAVRRRPF